MKQWIHKKGSKGQEVARLQAVLGGLVVDGKFGPLTEAALKDFQSKNNLPVTGQSADADRDILEIQIYPGIDISGWNIIDDWGALKSTNLVDFCWVKATEGNTFLSSKFVEHMNNAKAAGILAGAYHFARPDLHLDPHREVENFLKHCPLEKGNLRPVLDFEKAGDHSADSIRDWVVTFLEEFETQSGVKPVVYTGGNMVKYHLLGDTSGMDGHTLWHAYYPKSIDKGIGKKRLGGWKEWRVWQWTASGKLKGSSGKFDRNWLTGGKKGFAEIVI